MSGPVMDVADILQAQRKRFLERYQEVSCQSINKSGVMRAERMRLPVA